MKRTNGAGNEDNSDDSLNRLLSFKILMISSEKFPGFRICMNSQSFPPTVTEEMRPWCSSRANKTNDNLAKGQRNEMCAYVTQSKCEKGPRAVQLPVHDGTTNSLSYNLMRKSCGQRTPIL